METASKKVINGWAMYDWANSVYNLVITSTIFPTYFESVTGDGNDQTTNDHVVFLGRSFVNTALYNYSLSFAMLIVALISPLLSSIADYKGNKKKFLNFFLTMGSLACSLLIFFTSASTLYIGIVCSIVACVGFWGSLVYYNSYLPEIAAPEDRDMVSAKGFTYGYIGSVLLQVICFLFIFFPQVLGGDKDSIVQYQASFLLVGLWWWGFGQFSLSRLPKSVPAGTGDLEHHILSKGYRELRKVWNELKHLAKLKRFLFAYFFYNMGVQTVMLVAALYGKGELAMPTTNLIVAILIIQLIAIPGAYAISRLSSVIGNMKALMICIIVWIGICVYGYLIPAGNITQFYILGTVIGFVMGGIQSLSRSTYSKLMPITRDTASFFSFYDVTEKIGMVIGTLSFGIFTELTGSQRSSVLSVMSFFIIGFVLLLFTNNTLTKEHETNAVDSLVSEPA
jgi:MFS transporter, UMF1 family